MGLLCVLVLFVLILPAASVAK